MTQLNKIFNVTGYNVGSSGLWHMWGGVAQFAGEGERSGSFGRGNEGGRWKRIRVIDAYFLSYMKKY